MVRRENRWKTKVVDGKPKETSAAEFVTGAGEKSAVSCSTRPDRPNPQPQRFPPGLACLRHARPQRSFYGRLFPGSFQAANMQAIQAGCGDPSRAFFIYTDNWWLPEDASDFLHPFGFSNEERIAPRLAATLNALGTSGIRPPRQISLSA